MIQDARVFAQSNATEYHLAPAHTRSGVILHLSVNPLSDAENDAETLAKTSRRVESESLPIQFMRCSLVPQFNEALFEVDNFLDDDSDKLLARGDVVKKPLKQKDNAVKKFVSMKALIDHFLH